MLFVSCVLQPTNVIFLLAFVFSRFLSSGKIITQYLLFIRWAYIQTTAPEFLRMQSMVMCIHRLVDNLMNTYCLPGKKRIFCHHGINLGTNRGNVLLVLGIIEYTFNKSGNHCHHVLFHTTCGNGRCTQTDT